MSSDSSASGCAPDPACGENDKNSIFPPGSTPEARLNIPSALCSLGMTPRLVTGFIRQIFLQHFADINQIMNPSLRDKLKRDGAWTPDENSGLYIEALAHWRPELTEFRPAILIKEGDWNYDRRVIGDQAGQEWRDGRQFYAGFWKGSHTMFIVGKEAAETQLLSIEVAKLLLYYGPVICDQMQLHRFVMLRIGAVSALKEATENYVVPVSVAYVSEETWSLQVDAPRLKKISIDINAVIGYAGNC